MKTKQELLNKVEKIDFEIRCVKKELNLYQEALKLERMIKSLRAAINKDLT
jgi:hypothetical protein